MGEATTWPAFSMNSALQPQLLKLEEVSDEMVNSGTAFQEELQYAILSRCVGGQLNSYMNLTIGDNVQHSTLREQVLLWDRSQQKGSRIPTCSAKSVETSLRDIDVLLKAGGRRGTHR